MYSISPSIIEPSRQNSMDNITNQNGLQGYRFYIHSTSNTTSSFHSTSISWISPLPFHKQHQNNPLIYMIGNIENKSKEGKK